MVKKHLLLPALGILVAGSLMTGCSGCNQGDAETTGAAGGAGTENTNADGADADGHRAEDGDSHGAGDGHGHDGASADGTSADGGSGVGGSGMSMWDRVYATPAEERSGTVENLHGLRATLMAELEEVRGRLKDGTRSADDKKADQTRASELTQGLERLDRTIKTINEADDVTWAQVRDSELKAANEFRDWMAKYGMKAS